ncbi:hypothetical protein J3Q64DRAFT_1703501 [Phycomyces blakesleeanus]|uniref:Uncharacterized protein n=2 Tax=Phycomyces blakesleeanus TaxID=4837 RepID=A0A162N3Z4_PHYB8|nr:hypothetical protein PHYBLDRAFT_70732 [Phycomyces blakesleeanus NRRL 1555(-)]OAD65614.1 hypothetical protein PHYBLDRAFT_70732 [Phycomyces blakesleeanus NRRL 1555(-)]|eukprot:XP_018283654.1 hypothetical protein PHYBLDRAFT_70732 [Phycomyces blakesleeanus NRRL 1555(-)]
MIRILVFEAIYHSRSLKTNRYTGLLLNIPILIIAMPTLMPTLDIFTYFVFVFLMVVKRRTNIQNKIQFFFLASLLVRLINYTLKFIEIWNHAPLPFLVLINLLPFSPLSVSLSLTTAIATAPPPPPPIATTKHDNSFFTLFF